MKTNQAILLVAAIILVGPNSPVAQTAEENWPQFLGPGAVR